MREKTNLLIETLDILGVNGKTPDEVCWVGNCERYMYWKDFAAIARYINYDADYGSEKINGDLVVVGGDWWLERVNYDGEEKWKYQTLWVKPREYSVALKVISSVLRKTKEMLHHKEEPTDGGHKYEDEIITINNWWINECREEALDQALLIIEDGCKPSDVLECMMSDLLDNLELNRAFEEFELFAGKLADRMAEEHNAASKRIGWGGSE